MTSRERDPEIEFFGKPLSSSDAIPPTTRSPDSQAATERPGDEPEPENTRAKKELLEFLSNLPDPTCAFEKLITRRQSWQVGDTFVEVADGDAFMTIDLRNGGGKEFTREEAEALSMALLEASGAIR